MANDPTAFIAMPLSEILEMFGTIVSNKILETGRLLAEQPKEDLIPIEEACKFLRVSKVTIHKWKKQKLISAYRIGRKIYFKKHELVAALHSGAVKKRA